MFKKKEVIKLSGEIDMSANPTEIRIKPTKGDPWVDFGYWLEATSFMAKQAMNIQEWDVNQMKKYMADYFDSALQDYEVKT